MVAILNNSPKAKKRVSLNVQIQTGPKYNALIPHSPKNPPPYAAAAAAAAARIIMPLQLFRSFAKKKSLYFCITESPLNCSIRSLPGNMLFQTKSSHQKKRKTKLKPPPWKEVASYYPCANIGCAVFGSNMYVAGVLPTDFLDKNPDLLTGGSFYGPDLNYSSKSIYGYNIATRSSFPVPEMISPKALPMVFAVGESLYVLYGSRPEQMHSPDLPVFEAYTLSTKKWEQLDPPPFLNPKSEHFNPRTFLKGYTVIGKSICISSRGFSFKFDTEKKIWEPCMLFDGLHTSPTHYTTPCGPPFGFTGDAILFEDDILLCSNMNYGVVAYKIKDGKVEQSQCLRAQGLVMPVGYAGFARIVDFGNGLFCLVVVSQENYDEPSVFILKSFFIKKKTGLELEAGDFLHCEVVNELNYAKGEDAYPVGCFVL